MATTLSGSLHYTEEARHITYPDISTVTLTGGGGKLVSVGLTLRSLILPDVLPAIITEANLGQYFRK